MDSLYRGVMHSEVESQVAAVLNTDKDMYKTYIPTIQQQENSVDCGLYVIANAVEFAFTEDIRKVSFDSQLLRAHWLKCVEKHEVTPFPRTEEEHLDKEGMDSVSTNVYCVCRLPEHYSKIMIDCDGVCATSYHPACVGLKDIPDGEWKCELCSKDFACHG